MHIQVRNFKLQNVQIALGLFVQCGDDKIMSSGFCVVVLKGLHTHTHTP